MRLLEALHVRNLSILFDNHSFTPPFLGSSSQANDDAETDSEEEEEDEDMLGDMQEPVPKAFPRGRRTSVSAESLDASKYVGWNTSFE